MKEIDGLEEKMVSDWMQRLSEQTLPPSNLPKPGLILFKAELIKKRKRTERAVLPVIWMQATAVAIFAAVVFWLLLSSRSPLSSLFSETLASLMSVGVLFVFGAIAAAVICLAFAFVLRRD
ncbi:MAG TPA: hypothetical protein VL325_01370 [Pyrinomonadaceae bacterium]|nr:hypothetical protein [Pyrinomonadaceae bacterium]